MAVDLSCYMSRTKDDVANVLKSLTIEHRELFKKNFLLSPVRETNPVHNEIALDYGLDAKSISLVSLNHKNSAELAQRQDFEPWMIRNIQSESRTFT